MKPDYFGRQHSTKVKEVTIEAAGQEQDTILDDTGSAQNETSDEGSSSESENAGLVYYSVSPATYYPGIRQTLRPTAGEASKRYAFDVALVDSVMRGKGHVVEPSTFKEAIRNTAESAGMPWKGSCFPSLQKRFGRW